MTIKDRVLVVEDEKSISGLIKAILTANGYDVITASTGNEAFSMISTVRISWCSTSACRIWTGWI